MNWLVEFFTDPANWSGPSGIPVRLLEHLQFSLAALFVAALIAIPSGLLIGHTGRGALLVVVLANVARAMPTLGLLVLIVLILGTTTVLPVMIPLVLLAVPLILVNTFEGVRGVDRELRDAAYGMGLRDRQVLLRVLVPVALPLILTGVRLAAVQVVATATVASYVGLGGLGRYIIDGLATKDYPSVLGGSVLVAALALIMQSAFTLVDRLVVSPGVSRRVKA
ncbi:ABC transporter permease [Thermostaphylospora chromogena]|uniref:Osmoprotectant transport system permease protein n=1 Tax=Thermostaphylospora chromogena TaxID=35622 RepID=A0A1H1AJN1_9ACTN|nr:ABC transporter permease [Thermostaphylospora chromogena]SDQ39842.1 osmoprotectant transport system permease protein [Thermostaphylospora chromogena]